MSEDLRPLAVKIPVKIMPPEGTETSQESLCVLFGFVLIASDWVCLFVFAFNRWL